MNRKRNLKTIYSFIIEDFEGQAKNIPKIWILFVMRVVKRSKSTFDERSRIWFNLYDFTLHSSD